MVPTTVIIPTRDRPASLDRAVQSVLDQETSVEAILIVDDGSTVPVAFEGSNRAEVKIVRHEQSGGPSSARNSGVDSATTEWVTFLDDDDELDPAFASKLAEVIEGTPPPDFIWSGVRYRRADGSAQGERTFSDLGTDRESLCREALDVGTGYGLTVRTDHFRGLGGFDTSLILTEDTDYMIRAIGAGLQPGVIRSPMVQITNHSGVRQTSAENDGRRIQECETILAKHDRLWGELAYVQDWLQQRVVDLRGRLSGKKFVTKCEGFSAGD